MTTRVTPDVGSGRIMISDGGPHPPMSSAQAVVDTIVGLNKDITAERAVQVLRMKADMIEALEPIFGAVIRVEQEALQADPETPRLEILPASFTQFIEQAVETLQRSSDATPWKLYFTEPTTVAAIRDIFAVYFADAHFIERSWHADRRPDTAHAIAFTAAHRTPTVYAVTEEDIARAKAETRANGG